MEQPDPPDGLKSGTLHRRGDLWVSSDPPQVLAGSRSWSHSVGCCSWSPVLGLWSAGTSAITGSSTLPATTVGDGTSTIDGATASSIGFAFNGDRSRITGATLQLVDNLTSGIAVRAAFGTDSCSNRAAHVQFCCTVTTTQSAHTPSSRLRNSRVA